MASVRRLLLAANYTSESEALHHLIQAQESSNNCFLDLELLDNEPPVLQGDKGDDGRHCSHSLLEDLLLYLVRRKFEATANSGESKTILGLCQQTLAHWERHDTQQTMELDTLVEVLHGLLLRSEWNSTNVCTLNRVVKRLQDPRGRQRFLTFAFQILQQSLQPEIKTSCYDESVRLLLLGVTDVWSAIRRDCAKNTSCIVFEFSSPNQIDQFIESLLCVAIGSRSVSADKSQVTAWTEREGALLTLLGLLRSITMDTSGQQVAAGTEPKPSQVKDDIKGLLGICQAPVRYHFGSTGRHTLTQLPRFMVQTLKPAIYQCLRHDQLSVRQLAAQCLVAYASLCKEPTRLLIFQEVVSKLNRLNRNESLEEMSCVLSPNETELLDAFEAEGLLDVLARMTPCLPSTFLLKHWKIVFPTLEKYVMHIASSVRQKSSNVVLALAQPSLSSSCQLNDPLSSISLSIALPDESSLWLTIQMLRSLSQKREADNDFCWQRKEGRLMSIDVLLKAFGESFLACGSDACKLMRWKPESTKFHQRRSSSLAALQSFLWAHDQAQSATWVLDTDTETSLDEADYNETEKASLVHAISNLVAKNKGQNGLPASSQEFWFQVLSGCIAQAREAFGSSQFELRRISRQVLPGLLRLLIWTEQLEAASLTEIEAVSWDASWCWTCVKYILLHLRYLDESMAALSLSPNCCALQSLGTNWKVVWNSIIALERRTHRPATDAEAILAQVEGSVMAFLTFGAKADASHQAIRLLDSALQTIHEHLPENMQLQTTKRVQNTLDSSGGSLDRQFCTFMVPLLPAIVATLQCIAEFSENSEDIECLWTFRWLCLERIVVAWLLCDDMLRWITLSKSEAQSQLLESLNRLLQFSKIGLSPAEENDEIGRLLCCLEDTFCTLQLKGTRMNDAVYMNLVELHLRLWLCSVENGGHNTTKVITVISQIYSQQQQYLIVPDSIAKPAQSSSTCSVAEVWDDWDDDERGGQQVSLASEICSSTTLDPLFQEVLVSFDTNQLSQLCETARTLQDVPTHHFPRMLQQMEACLCSSMI